MAVRKALARRTKRCLVTVRVIRTLALSLPGYEKRQRSVRILEQVGETSLRYKTPKVVRG